MIMTEATGALQIVGTIFIESIVNGVKQGLKEVPGMIEFSVTPKSKVDPQKSRDRATAGQVTAVVAQQEPAELKIKFSAFNPKVMAIAMMGESSVIDVAAATATNVAVAAKLDCFVKIGSKNLVAGTVVKNTAGTVTYIPDVDYTLNHALGLLQALSTGAITEGQALKLDVANAAYSGFLTRGATTPSINAYILVDGENLADHENVSLEIDHAVLTATSPVMFMSDKMSEMEMTGFMVTLPGSTDPWRMEKTASA